MTYKDFYKKYLPKDIARKAINNSEDLMLEREVEKGDWNDVQSPLIRGFVWGSTKEGHDFWGPYHYKLIHPDMENTRVKHFEKKILWPVYLITSLNKSHMKKFYKFIMFIVKAPDLKPGQKYILLPSNI